MEQFKYDISIGWSNEDECYVARVNEIEYCTAHGNTYEEALKEIKEAIKFYIEVAKEKNKPIPEPKSVAV